MNHSGEETMFFIYTKGSVGK